MVTLLDLAHGTRLMRQSGYTVRPGAKSGLSRTKGFLFYKEDRAYSQIGADSRGAFRHSSDFFKKEQHHYNNLESKIQFRYVSINIPKVHQKIEARFENSL